MSGAWSTPTVGRSVRRKFGFCTLFLSLKTLPLTPDISVHATKRRIRSLWPRLGRVGRFWRLHRNFCVESLCTLDFLVSLLVFGQLVLLSRCLDGSSCMRDWLAPSPTLETWRARLSLASSLCFLLLSFLASFFLLASQNRAISIKGMVLSLCKTLPIFPFCLCCTVCMVSSHPFLHFSFSGLAKPKKISACLVLRFGLLAPLARPLDGKPEQKRPPSTL
jgi:hypothetical protein